MKKIVLGLLICLFSFQSTATCIEKYNSTKVGHYLFQMDRSNQDLINIGSSTAGLAVGVSSAIAFTFVGGVAMLAIASGPIMVGNAIKAIKNRKENRAIKLINQSYAYVDGNKAKRLLRSVSKKVIRNNPQSTTLDIALAIVKGNEDMTLCLGESGVREIKQATMDGDLIIVE